MPAGRGCDRRQTVSDSIPEPRQTASPPTAIQRSHLRRGLAPYLREPRFAWGGPAVIVPDAHIEALERLTRLRDAGALDDEEFRREKQLLIQDGG